MVVMTSRSARPIAPTVRRLAVVGIALSLTLVVAAIASAHDTWLDLRHQLWPRGHARAIRSHERRDVPDR